jgi:hypothetical protein
MVLQTGHVARTWTQLFVSKVSALLNNWDKVLTPCKQVCGGLFVWGLSYRWICCWIGRLWDWIGPDESPPSKPIPTSWGLTRILEWPNNWVGGLSSRWLSSPLLLKALWNYSLAASPPCYCPPLTVVCPHTAPTPWPLGWYNAVTRTLYLLNRLCTQLTTYWLTPI